MDLKWDKRAEDIVKEKGISGRMIKQMLSLYFNSMYSKGVDFYVKDNTIFVGKDDE